MLYVMCSLFTHAVILTVLTFINASNTTLYEAKHVLLPDRYS